MNTDGLGPPAGLGARLLLVIAREEPEDLFANAIKVDTHAPQHLSANPLTLVDKT